MNCPRSIRITLVMGEVKPEDVHRRRELFWLKSRQLARARETPVCADNELRSHFVKAVLSPVDDAPDHPVLLNESLCPRSHHQAKVGVLLRRSVKNSRNRGCGTMSIYG